ncbi:hypothetical protein F4778DRAFT_390966 [Xylariomycetidae sp. FL2044]|nr:hypothetical protein F4778DRAFT_775264 [Xylariomycetidae sp. FL2044]KAH9883375.1 hypothetical protein F4778DRAFT_775270 [Xylariomycetidae sp. FL2044]KAH9889103.1 hypothetical protein F4778DRAFT_390966 [Xylariomycetidae sp. FL2044]
MFTRRIVRAATTTPRALRAFSSTAAQQRTPSICDITPEGVSSFNAKQKEFREQLVKQQEEREASMFNRHRSKSSSSGLASGQGQGSSDETGQRAQASKNESEQPEGLISRVIYGTKEGRELDAQLEASFSAVLARGKYVHSIVFHEVQPDKVDEYIELVGKWYPKIASQEENKVHLVGSWRTEVGDCDTFVHIWEYQRYQGYHQSLNKISNQPDYPAFDKKLRSLIKSKHTSIMQEFSFWPTTAPRQLGGVFELRSYTLHPGNLLEWETHWRRGLKARREVMEGVGAWFVQIGDLNTVHHLWQFANLEERKVRREESWKQEGWAETVHKTVPLIQNMKSRILVPMPWSPVA